jgi:hypothetical protein
MLQLAAGVPFLIGMFSALSALVLNIGTASACDFEKFGDSPHVKISGTDWVADSWGQGCGFGISGGMEIRAANEVTHESIVVLSLYEIADRVKLSSDTDRTLTIALPNFSDIAESKNEFADVRVIYKFTPRDDPEARQKYQFWKHHPEKAEARDWYCKTILAKMDPEYRKMWNSIIGQSYPAGGAAGAKYCADL